MYYVGIGVLAFGLLALVYQYNPAAVPIVHYAKKDALLIGLLLASIGSLTVFIYRDR